MASQPKYDYEYDSQEEKSVEGTDMSEHALWTNIPSFTSTNNTTTVTYPLGNSTPGTAANPQPLVGSNSWPMANIPAPSIGNMPSYVTYDQPITNERMEALEKSVGEVRSILEEIKELIGLAVMDLKFP